jgi:oligoribonuclease NrnB/cAMP/cGMP phosphodiesterase (DHH superfamily)
VIAWEYFFPIEAVPLMFKYIDDYDRWQFKLEETKAFNKAIWSHTPWNFDQWKQILNVDDTETIKLAEEGKAILRAHNQNVMQVVKGSGRPCMIRWIDENGIVHMSKGLSANCPTYLTSDVGHKLAEESGTYGLLWTLNKDGKLLCSLRSTGNYDVSSIAKAFGGGGHLNAAGFEVSILTLLEWIK